MLGNLRALFGVMIDIALLRRGPESLPTSTALMAGAIALDLVVSALMISMLPNAPRNWPLHLAVGTIVTLLYFDVAFRITQKRERFVQTITGLFGVSALFAPAIFSLYGALLPYAEKRGPEMPLPFALGILTVVLAVWVVIVQARIVRAAFEWPFFVSIAFIVGQNFAAFVVFSILFGASQRPA